MDVKVQNINPTKAKYIHKSRQDNETKVKTIGHLGERKETRLFLKQEEHTEKPKTDQKLKLTIRKKSKLKKTKYGDKWCTLNTFLSPGFLSLDVVNIAI